MKTLRVLAIAAIFSTGLAFAQGTGSSTTAKPSAAASTTPKPKATATPNPPPSASDIAAAKAKGLVWVNLNTKVYHPSKDKEYGTTKNGKFMTEADAKAAGYKAAKS